MYSRRAATGTTSRDSCPDKQVRLGAESCEWGTQCTWSSAPWHVPTPKPVSIRTLATRAAELAGAPKARVANMPAIALRLTGLFSPDARELIQTQYQWQRPFILDSTAATVAFGIKLARIADALREMIDA